MIFAFNNMIGAYKQQEINRSLDANMMTHRYINDPTIDKGFYDDVFGVYPIIEYTIHKDTIVHVPKNKRYWRYNPFLMMGVLYSRLHIQSNQIKSYDDKIKKQLDIFIAKFSKKDINSLCSYSLGPLMIAFLLYFLIGMGLLDRFVS